MAREHNTDVTNLEDQLADARSQIDSLQSAAADAEARALTARAEADSLRETQADLQALLVESESGRDVANGEVQGLREQLRAAAARYREARLASAPDVPHDLVPQLDTIDDVDREFEAAQRIVGQLRERIQQEAVQERQAARVPAGAPGRRAGDTSALSPGEKIRLGLQQLSER